MKLARAHYSRNEGLFYAYAKQATKSERDLSELERLSARREKPKSPGLIASESRRLSDLILSPGVLAQLAELKTELTFRAQLQANGLEPRSRLLFTGPPGNGKTTCARALAGELGLDAYSLYLPKTVQSYMGATGAELGSIFHEMRDDRMIIVDELDAIACARIGARDGAEKERNLVVSTLLTLLDAPQVGVLVATTNRPEDLDSAIVRRFDAVIRFDAPTVERKRSLAERLTEKLLVDPVYVDDCENMDAVTKRVMDTARALAVEKMLKEVSK